MTNLHKIIFRNFFIPRHWPNPVFHQCQWEDWWPVKILLPPAIFLSSGQHLDWPKWLKRRKKDQVALTACKFSDVGGRCQRPCRLWQRGTEFTLTTACTSAEHLLMNETTDRLTETKEKGGGGKIDVVLQSPDNEKFNALVCLACLFCSYSHESYPAELRLEEFPVLIWQNSWHQTVFWCL